MNATQLKQWKEKQRRLDAEAVARCLVQGSDVRIRDFYPELELAGDTHTTSLDPAIPLWVVIPFFKKVVVGILPYLRTEKDFTQWYGVTPRQMLQLYEAERVALRILYPTRASTVPRYMNDFLQLGLPSTYRDLLFNQKVLGPTHRQELSERFQKMATGRIGSRSLDKFEGNSRRALSTAETNYLQLAALGETEAIASFEELLKTDVGVALDWLEMCRLCLIGPEHYSMGGIHSIPAQALDEARLRCAGLAFPMELGVTIIETFGLISGRSKVKGFCLEDCLAVYDNSQLARDVLLEVKKVADTGVKMESADDLRRLLETAKSRDSFWLRGLRIVASVGAAAAIMQFEPYIGLLTGLGFAVASEMRSRPLDLVVAPVAKKATQIGRKPAAALLMRLDDDVAKNFRAV